MGLESIPSQLRPAQQQELQRYENRTLFHPALASLNDVTVLTYFLYINKDLVMGKHKTKDENAATSSAENKDHSRDQESRDATLARIITEAVAQQTKTITEKFQRQMDKMHAQYEELLKTSCAQNFPSTLKVTSSSEGFRVMDPFDWTSDKNIYQRWQLWSHKARLALDAMEGDNEKTKISYLHHWLDGKGISKIKGWRNSKTLITQAEYDALEERDRKGKYSLRQSRELLFISRKYLDPQVKPFVSRGGITSRKARFYDF